MVRDGKLQGIERERKRKREGERERERGGLGEGEKRPHGVKRTERKNNSCCVECKRERCDRNGMSWVLVRVAHRKRRIIGWLTRSLRGGGGRGGEGGRRKKVTWKKGAEKRRKRDGQIEVHAVCQRVVARARKLWHVPLATLQPPPPFLPFRIFLRHSPQPPLDIRPTKRRRGSPFNTRSSISPPTLCSSMFLLTFLSSSLPLTLLVLPLLLPLFTPRV